jgi:hypothetical protein
MAFIALLFNKQVSNVLLILIKCSRHLSIIHKYQSQITQSFETTKTCWDRPSYRGGDNLATLEENRRCIFFVRTGTPLVQYPVLHW